MDATYFSDGNQDAPPRTHAKQPSTVSPLDTLGHPPLFDDVDMSTLDHGASHLPQGHFLNNNNEWRSRSADPSLADQRSPHLQQASEYHLFASSENASLHPGMSGPGNLQYGSGATSQSSGSPISPYPPTPQSNMQPSSFAFPSAGGSPSDSLHYTPDQSSLPYRNTRASRHKPQRSLSASELPRPAFLSHNSHLTRNNSLAPTPLPIQDCEPAQIPVKGTAVGAGAFVYKLYNMLLDTDYQNLIAFSHSGTSFIVSNATEFSKIVLPKHFKHNNFSSFVRQLNMYGFHKVNKTPRGQKGAPESQTWEFSHPKFVRGGVDLLDSIKRKAQDDTGNASDHGRMASSVGGSQPTTPATPYTPQQPRGSNAQQFGAHNSSAAYLQQTQARIEQQRGSMPPPNQAPITPSIALPDYLHMLHQHQSDLGLHINRLEETCQSLYHHVVEGNRRQDILVRVVHELFDALQQTDAKPPFAFPSHLFQGPQLPVFDGPVDYAPAPDQMMMQHERQYSSSPHQQLTQVQQEQLAGLGVSLDGLPPQ